MFSSSHRFSWTMGLALLAGCGAKTGLDLPDAAIDAPMAIDSGPPPPPPPPCIEVPREMPRVLVDLEIPATLRVVDIMFLIDSTASMQDEIDSVRTRLRDVVVPGVRAIIPDAAFGVALFGEFPVPPHAPRDSRVQPFLLRTPITTDVVRVETALDETPVWGNLDDPEAAIEGVYQVVTGEGLPPFIMASVGCPGGGVGGACFRSDAFRVLMLVTDAPMHNGPPDVPPIAPYRFEPAPHTYDDAVRAVRAADVFLIGLGATDRGRPAPLPHLRELARNTGSLDSSGVPLVFDIGLRGDAIGEEIVSAVRRVAADVPLDIDAVAEDLPGDGVDARDIVRGIRASRAQPSSGVVRVEGPQFLGVRPGTLLTFELEIDASEVPSAPERREYPARVVFRESGRSRIEVREILIVIPGDDGLGCVLPPA